MPTELRPLPFEKLLRWTLTDRKENAKGAWPARPPFYFRR